MSNTPIQVPVAEILAPQALSPAGGKLDLPAGQILSASVQVAPSGLPSGVVLLALDQGTTLLIRAAFPLQPGERVAVEVEGKGRGQTLRMVAQSGRPSETFEVFAPEQVRLAQNQPLTAGLQSLLGKAKGVIIGQILEFKNLGSVPVRLGSLKINFQLESGAKRGDRLFIRPQEKGSALGLRVMARGGPRSAAGLPGRGGQMEILGAGPLTRNAPVVGEPVVQGAVLAGTVVRVSPALVDGPRSSAASPPDSLQPSSEGRNLLTARAPRLSGGATPVAGRAEGPTSVEAVNSQGRLQPPAGPPPNLVHSSSGGGNSLAADAPQRSARPTLMTGGPGGPASFETTSPPPGPQPLEAPPLNPLHHSSGGGSSSPSDASEGGGAQGLGAFNKGVAGGALTALIRFGGFDAEVPWPPEAAKAFPEGSPIRVFVNQTAPVLDLVLLAPTIPNTGGVYLPAGTAGDSGFGLDLIALAEGLATANEESPAWVSQAIKNLKESLNRVVIKEDSFSPEKVREAIQQGGSLPSMGQATFGGAEGAAPGLREHLQLFLRMVREAGLPDGNALSQLSGQAEQALTSVEFIQAANGVRHLLDQGSYTQIPFSLGGERGTIDVVVRRGPEGGHESGGENDQHSVVFFLELQGLGPLRVDAGVHAKRVHARFTTQIEDVGRFLEAELPVLREAMERQDFLIEGLSWIHARPEGESLVPTSAPEAFPDEQSLINLRV